MAPWASSRGRFFLRFFSGGGVFGASSGVGRRSILFLHLSRGRGGFSGELCFTFDGIMRFALPFSVEFGRDVCTRPRGSCASGPSSSLMAAPVCLFPCHHWSGSGRSSFNVLGMSWMAHGVDCCSDSKVWSCSSILAGGLLPDVIVKLCVLGCVLCVFYVIFRVFHVKRVYTVLPGAI
jgi:hypothetical protein